ncbi:SEC-C domain-containing protein [Simiduia sp. 21SJ11W-1]|uniref:YchJ family protein n=1 Tax=Simiduia sp. 21SJ11W-1 TaxID=2909669 RepID=UPI00209D86DB|nr:YchJ family metal-binding protein [Simiduia sp. 21SJ11W-1]UTA46824.1 SEC-C domain-containing protein [Simiduia sp. 21SJ11W-1]
MLPNACPCGSANAYAQCCAPLHQGAPAATPEALMRSRFSAHALGLLDYILASWASEARAAIDTGALSQWLGEAQFGQLRVLGAQQDWVEFECWYLQAGQLHSLHDRSFFIQEDGHWRYAASDAPRLKATQIGRNDRCPCGSQKKFKQCCAGRLAD